jgi:hypothetical protein
MTLVLAVPQLTAGEKHPLLNLGGDVTPATVEDIGTPLTTLVPLTREFFVDAGTPATLAQQNGSIAFPFATVQQGVNALALVGSLGGVLLIAPGDYTSQLLITVPALCPVDFVNLGASVGGIVSLLAIIGSSAVALVGITVTGGGGGTVNLGGGNNLRLDRSTTSNNVICQDATLVNSTITGTLTCRAYNARGSTVTGNIGASGLVTMQNCVLGGLASFSGSAAHRIEETSALFIIANGVGASLLLRNSQLSSNLLCTAVNVEGCSIAGTFDCAGATTITDSTVGGACTLTQAVSTFLIENSRFGSTYTANGVGQTTSFRNSSCVGNFAATIAIIFSASFGGNCTTTGNMTARFVDFASQVNCGGAATFYKARCSNVTQITGALVSDFDSIAAVLPVLSFGSFILQTEVPRITLSVAVPVVANDQVGYVNVSLVGTGLAGLLAADSLIVANPTTDLVGAGAGGGYINVRFNAANSLRFAFLGPLAGGAANFSVGLV